MDLLYVHKMLIYMLHLCAHLKLHIKRVLVDQILSLSCVLCLMLSVCSSITVLWPCSH